MLKPVDSAARQTRLADLGVVRAQGADAIKFLQGQVSNDVERLTAETSVLAGLHNPQGRAIALLRLVLAGPDEILAIVPRELAAPVAARLSKFVLRAKVKISDVSAEWDVAGIEVGSIAAGLGVASVGAARRDEEGRVWACLATIEGRASRWLMVSHGTAPLAAPSMSRDEWRALDIAAGIPQIYAATSEAFVAQMLNLDLLDGIAFDKGCYTGQEVIARAHYRGKVKRRMQRFRTREAAKLAANDSGTLADGRTFKVVDAVQLGDGRCEFLAVTNFDDAASADVTAADAATGSGASALTTAAAIAGTVTSETPPVSAEQLPLPYPLPP
jgi:tRNA-modifying protein YgfZ